MEADLVRKRRDYLVHDHILHRRTRRELIGDSGLSLTADLPESIFPNFITPTDLLIFQFEHYFYDFCAFPELEISASDRLPKGEFEVCHYLYAYHCHNTVSRL